MKRLICLGLFYLGLGLADAYACSVPFIRTPDNQTVDGRMSVRSGKRCNIILSRSLGPMHSVEIVRRPSYGSVSVLKDAVFYHSRPGYVGSDSFTYARRGFDSRKNPVVRTVRIAVTVTP